jgi:hypothetical protein
MKLKNNFVIYLVIVFLLIAPWFNSSADQIDYIPELSQEANPFYEINPCKISLFEFFNICDRFFISSNLFKEFF